MRKLLSTVFAAVMTFLVTLSVLTGCDWLQEKEERTLYYGVMRTIEGSDGLFLYIPNVGDCCLPAYEEGVKEIVIKDGHVYNDPLKEGDVVRLEFATNEVCFLESYPLQISTPVKSVWVYQENITLENDETNWLLTMVQEDYLQMLSYDSPEPTVGEYVEIRRAYFLTGEGTGSGKCDSATVEQVEDGRITLRLYLEEDIALFLKYFASGALQFKGVGVEDFSFSLTWGTFGISSYDSKTGKLVKTKDAPNPEEYITTYYLTLEEKARIYAILLALDMPSYPDVYDPTEGIGSDPYGKLILSVQSETLDKTITAEQVALSEATSEKGQKFMDACSEIREILTATDEWKALPDYPYLYD